MKKSELKQIIKEEVKLLFEYELKVGDNVECKYPLDIHQGTVKRLDGAKIIKIVTVKSEEDASAISLAIMGYWKKKKKQFEVAITDAKIAIPITQLKLKRKKSELKETIKEETQNMEPPAKKMIKGSKEAEIYGKELVEYMRNENIKLKKMMKKYGYL